MIGVTFLDETDNCFEILKNEKWAWCDDRTHDFTESRPKRWRQNVENLRGSCPSVERGNVFSKARKKKTEVAFCRRGGELVYESWRSAADAEAAEQIKLKNNRVNCKFSLNAKTHQGCAADCIRYAWHRRTSGIEGYGVGENVFWQRDCERSHGW